MHGAAQAAQEADFTRENLRHCAIQEEVLCRLLHVRARELLSDFLIKRAAHVVLHDVFQFIIRELVDCRERLCDDLVVASMAAENEIVCIQIVCFADCRSFLADGKVRRAGIGVVAEVCFLIFDGLVILVDVDILEMNLSRSPKLVRVSIQTLWHFTFYLSLKYRNFAWRNYFICIISKFSR